MKKLIINLILFLCLILFDKIDSVTDRCNLIIY